MKIVNSRKCILTNEVKPKAELIRIVKQKKGDYLVDSDAKGRGAYISRQVTNPQLIIKKRVLNRSFRAAVPIEVYNKLIALLKKGD